MLLTIDAGNTRVKWGIFDESGLLTNTGACLHTDFSSATLPNTEKAIVSCVTSQSILTDIQGKLQHNKNVVYAKSAPHYNDLVNTYENIDQLGTDRWMSAIACWHMLHDTCLIVNAGTAITVDVIQASADKANYIGGWIAPGITTMQQSLAQNTAQLSISNANPPFTQKNAMIRFGLNTQSSIKNGTIASAVGMVSIGYQQLSNVVEKPVSVIVSGGDANIIAQQCHLLGIKASIDEHLVLKGLFAAAQQAST